MGILAATVRIPWFFTHVSFICLGIVALWLCPQNWKQCASTPTLLFVLYFTATCWLTPNRSFPTDAQPMLFMPGPRVKSFGVLLRRIWRYDLRHCLSI